MSLLTLTHKTPTLRPYQEEAIRAVEYFADEGRHAALLVLPTGTGKTVIFSTIIRQWNTPTLVLAHREELLTQAREKLLTIWPGADIGIIGAGRDERGHQITIASVQAVIVPSRFADVAAQRYGLVVVDEAHHTPSASYRRILAATHAGEEGGPFLLGVTATPDRADGKALDAIYGPTCFRVLLAEMIAQGYLCDLRGLAIESATRLDGVTVRAGDFAEESLAAAVNVAERNRVIVDAWQRHAADRLTVAFCVDVKHAHDLAALFRDAGIAAAALDGETPRDERQRILHDFAAGAIRVLCNCGVLVEGFDMSDIQAVILARPTASRSLYVQCVGRGARPAPGKVDCLVLDVADVTSRHALTVVSLPQLAGRPAYQVDPPAANATASDNRDRTPRQFSMREALTEELPRALHVVERDVRLVAEPWPWKASGVGNYALPVGDVVLLLHLRESGYIPRIRFADGDTQDLAHVPLSLDFAQCLAEQAALQIRDGRGHFVDRRARWRSDPASPNQLRALKRLGVRVRNKAQLTKGEASDLINRAMMGQSA